MSEHEGALPAFLSNIIAGRESSAAFFVLQEWKDAMELLLFCIMKPVLRRRRFVCSMGRSLCAEVVGALGDSSCTQTSLASSSKNVFSD